MTQTAPKPVVSTYVERLQAATDSKRAEEAASRAERQRQAEAKIRNGELASQLRRTPIDEDVSASSSSMPRLHQQGMAEIDGKAVPASSDLRSNDDLSTAPVQSSVMSLPAASNSRIQVLETQLATQNTRIETLEVARDDLTRQVADLQSRRDEAEKALEAATIAGIEVKKQHEVTVAELRRQLEAVKEDRRKAEKEIEELSGTVRELQKELDKERRNMSTLEQQIQPLERPDGTIAAPAVAASTVGTSSRRSSAGENERRRHGHRRSNSNSLFLSIGVELKRGDDKEKKKKKTTHK